MDWDRKACLERADRLMQEGAIGDREIIAEAIMDAILHERELCARIAERADRGDPSELGRGIAIASDFIAISIRRRG